MQIRSEFSDQHIISVVYSTLFSSKVGVLRASHKIFNSEVRIC
jgi:hypothetical protein